MTKTSLKTFVLTWMLLLSASAFLLAQNGTSASRIGFEKTSHDFGNIKEAEGPVTYEFKFTNNTQAPITISNVQASCGCTTPSWTRSAVEPGMSGYVKARFDPTNRPNGFTKSLSVSYSAGSSVAVEVLTIKGYVVPKTKTVSELFPAKKGNLRIGAEYLNFYNISTKEPVTKEFKIYNEGNKKLSLQIADKEKTPAHLKVKIIPSTLAPKDTGVIRIVYDAKARKDYGYVYDLLNLSSDDSLEATKTFYVVASISEYFPPLSKADSLKMPKISFDRSVHNFGTIQQGDVVTTNFVLTNTGKTELKIHKTKASCGCTVSVPEKNQLAPGEKTNLKVTFDSAGKAGHDTKSVTIFSNDPTYPEATILIKSEIQTTIKKDSSQTK
jgi:hypothetical protein